VKLRVVKHRKATRDALQIFTYIGENNLDAAARFLRALDQDIRRLGEMPGIGAERDFDDPALAGLRSLPVSDFTNYLIFYRIMPSEVQVLRVLHGARDLPSVLRE
jgi:toxin ParE1/3/4